MTSIPRPARALRAGDTITRHPEQRIRYLVEIGARTTYDGVVVDYTAPATELPGCTPNDRATGRLLLNPNQRCEIEPAGTYATGGNR